MIKTRYSSFLAVFFILAFSTNLIILNEDSSENNLNTSNSNESWSRIPINNKEIPSSNLHLLNDSIILTGIYYDNVHYDYDVIVIKYHENGTKLWDFRLENDLDVDIVLSVVDRNKDINIFMIVDNSSYDWDTDVYSTVLELYFLKINEDGELIVLKRFQNLPHCHIHSVSLDLDNYNYITGIDYQNHTVFLMKLDSNGNMVYSIPFNDTEWKNVKIDNYGGVFVFPMGLYKDGPLYKFDSNGTLLWKRGTNENLTYYLKSDDAGNVIALYEKNYSINSTKSLNLVKINSSGEPLDEIKIISGDRFVINQMLYQIRFHCSDDNSYFFFEEEGFIMKYDDNCSLQWNRSLEEYMNPYYASHYRMISDSDDNIYLLYHYNENFDSNGVDIAILKVNSTGEFVSQDIWGGNYNEHFFEACCDSQKNLYLIVSCEYANFWGFEFYISVLVKNPLNGGFPPPLELDSGFYFVFTILGVSSAISVMISITIIRKIHRRPITSGE